MTSIYWNLTQSEEAIIFPTIANRCNTKRDLWSSKFGKHWVKNVSLLFHLLIPLRCSMHLRSDTMCRIFQAYLTVGLFPWAFLSIPVLRNRRWERLE